MSIGLTLVKSLAKKHGFKAKIASQLISTISQQSAVSIGIFFKTLIFEWSETRLVDLPVVSREGRHGVPNELI